MTSPTPDFLTRRCEECGQEKEVRFFYRNAPTICRKCLVDRNAAIPLATKVEGHRQEKEVKRLLRAELKKIARERLRQRRRRRKERAQADLIPKIEAEAVDVDPATQELAKRELARRRLIDFIQEFHPRYKAGWVHHDICRRLEKFIADVAAGKSPRLILLMPPRHGKSQIASKMFPAWLLGHHRWFEVIACSYNVTLALEFSREVRAVVRSDRYGVLFPETKIDPDIQGAEAWKLLSPTGVGAGGYMAAGIGGPITGKGAHVLIIDDPIKNAEEAESPEHRKKLWNWYTSTAYTRLAPGGGVLVIQTCWHDDDLAGRLQAEMKADPEADQFEVVKYPAMCVDEDEEFREVGDPLHPERYDAEALNRIKRTLGSKYWAALYQQDPVPEEGAFFTRDMIVHRDAPPYIPGLHIYQAWDFAISTKRQNDYTVGVTIGVDHEDVAHVLEVRRFRSNDAGFIVDEMLDMFARYKTPGVMVVGAEDSQIWRTMHAVLQKRMTERGLYPYFEVQKPLTDKAVRARPLQARMQHRKVTFPRSAPWLEALEKEMLRFPEGVHDDMVDALAWAVTLVIGKAPPRAPRARNRPGEKTVAEILKAHLSGSRGGHMAS